MTLQEQLEISVQLARLRNQVRELTAENVRLRQACKVRLWADLMRAQPELGDEPASMFHRRQAE